MRLSGGAECDVQMVTAIRGWVLNMSTQIQVWNLSVGVTRSALIHGVPKFNIVCLPSVPVHY